MTVSIPTTDEPIYVRRTACAALRYDAMYRRWEGNLHFRSGTCRVYLSENPKYGKKGQPEWFINAVAGDVRIGLLHKYPGGNYWDGQLNTEKPIALRAYRVTDRDGNARFVIHRLKAKRTPPRTPIVLYLTPWPQGERYEEKEWHSKKHYPEVVK